MGQGVDVAIAQIVADELDVPFASHIPVAAWLEPSPGFLHVRDSSARGRSRWEDSHEIRDVMTPDIEVVTPDDKL